MNQSMLQFCAIVLAFLLVSSTIADDESDQTSTFDSPVLLKVGSEPLNNDGSIMYPSPAIFDVDNDGKNELVLGSIFGGLYSCEDQSTVPNKHEWTAPVPLESRDGEPLKLNNW